MTSFFAFSNEVRPKLKKENPDMPFGELGKKLGELFRGLSAEEKEKYEKLARHDKQRYEKDLAAYKASHEKHDSDEDGLNEEIDGKDSDDSDDSND